MKVPLEILFRGVERTEAIETLIREKAAGLEKVCNYIISCRVAVELPKEHQKSGRPYRIRITLYVPPGHEVVVRRESTEGMLHDELPAVIREAFEAARRQLKKLVEKQRGEVKSHPAEGETTAFVVRLFDEEGYGFLKALDGRELYFHKNAVLHDDFDRLAIGTAVRFEESMGEKGPQASTVQIVDKPGSRVDTSGEFPIEPPLGWGESKQ